MNIFKREFKASLKGLLIWCGAYLAMMGLASTEFSVYQGQAQQFQDFLNALPEALRQAFALEGLRLDIPEGYFSYIASFIILASVIYAGLAGAQILSKEINKKTSETTFTLPVTRQRVIAVKFGVAALDSLILTAVTFVGAMAAFARFGIGADFITGVGKFMLVILALQLLFLLAGLFLSVVSRRQKRVGTMVAGLIVGIYFLSFLSNLSASPDFLKYLTPFDYFPASNVIQGGHIGLFGFVVVPVLIALFFAGAFKLITSKDL